MPQDMFGWLQVVFLLMTAAAAGAVVLTREPRRQVLLVGVYGLVLTLLLMTLQAPDVALAELAVGVVATPLMLLAALISTSKPNPNAPTDDHRSDEAGGQR